MRTLLVVLGPSLATACTTEYQKGAGDPSYGTPNALAKEAQPESSEESIACVKNGGSLVDGGTCAVSFQNDVLPALFRSTCANTACHGGESPPNPPRIDPNKPGEMWATFAAFKMSERNLPYINPCSTDETAAGMACNLHPTGSCGVKMPSGGPQMPQADLDRIEEWLKCGSPNN